MNKKPLNSNPTKEFFSLLKTLEKNTKNQAKIKSYNPDDISTFVIEICPRKGLYQNAKFLFQIQLVSYPREFPNVICLSDIYHPNIEHGEDYHNVCLNLFDNWNRSFGLIDVVQGLIFLLYQPNLTDPISSMFSSKNTSDEVFRRNVHTSLHGGFIDGIEFLPNPGIIEYESKLNGCQEDSSNNKLIVDEGQVLEDEKNRCKTRNEKEETKQTNGETFSREDDYDDELAAIMNNNNAISKFTKLTEDEITTVDKPALSVNITDQGCDVDGKDIIPMIAVVELTQDDHNCDSKLAEEPITVNGDVPINDANDDDSSQYDEDEASRHIISPNAFYSDLICARYSQPDQFSESEYGSTDIWDTSVIFDTFGLPIRDYSTEESDISNPYGGYYSDDDDDDDDDYPFEHPDDTEEYDQYVIVPSNHRCSPYPFLKGWHDLRMHHNERDAPSQVTVVILTNVLNIFRSNISTFMLCRVQNNSLWRPNQPSLYRVNQDDRTLRLVVWLQNISRWAMRRSYRLPMSDWTADQSLWYSIFSVLHLTIHYKLRRVYRSNFDVLFIR